MECTFQSSSFLVAADVVNRPGNMKSSSERSCVWRRDENITKVRGIEFENQILKNIECNARLQ